MLNYDYVIVGAGVVGCSVAYELSKYSHSILLIDKNSDVALAASGAAGAFLSPLLGKENLFKDLVTKSLIYSTKFYQTNFPQYFNPCGTTRIPKNKEDEEKFKSYIPYMDFEYEKDEQGYFFKIGSVIDSFNMCKAIIKSVSNHVSTKFNYEVSSIEYKDGKWFLNDTIGAQNIIFTTGSDVSLIDQFYLKIRSVWGRRIDISTSSTFKHNYHKECSISQSKSIDKINNFVSIGATHYRDKAGIDDIEANTDELIKKANDIKKLQDIKILNHYVGARACSIDYFPIVGDIIDEKKTLKEFPYLKNGTKVETKRFTRYKNAYILTGVGGRGFVFAPYLANLLVNHIVNSAQLDKNITIDRLFQREVKRIK
ncbi:MAG: D-amino-acid oxidase [Arcobacter sp.]|nr:MAG: D-amino-acid oxidase [Arcobacter sp.]